MKRFFPLLVAILGLFVLLFAVHQCRQRSAANYQTTAVSRGPITQAVTATGTLNPVVNVRVQRSVIMRDGILLSDSPVSRRLDAAAELQRVGSSTSEES